MKSAQDVVQTDLAYICENLSEEFGVLSGKNLLITGGAGFLGYYLVQAISHWNRHIASAKPIRLTVYDNYFRGVPRWLKALEGEDHIVLKEHDVTNPLPEDIADYPYIIHGATIASPFYYRKYPIQTMDANVNGLRYLLEHFWNQQQGGIRNGGFLFFSTSEIYGDPAPESIPTPETYNGNVSCTGPRACYDESKRFGETLCVNFAQQHGLPIKTVRPFNNYGPGLKITDRRALPDFARDVIAGRDIVMYSDGSPTRTFCYIADAIVGYYKVLVKGQSGEAYNIGSDKPEISILTLANRVVESSRNLLGYKGKVVRQVSEDKDYLVDNPNRRCPVIEKARSELGYDPSISLDEGLKRALLWYADHHADEGEL